MHPTMSDLTVDELDADGALGEAVERISRSRADVLRAAAAGGGALLGLLAVPTGAVASRTGDRDILNYALTLEYLLAAFYKDAVMMKKLRGDPARAARIVGAVEESHVNAYRRLLGRAAVKRPRFHFRGTTEEQGRFLRTAIALEDLSVAAYKAQIPLVASPRVLAAAVSIHSVEARHAAWMRRLFGVVPARTPFDEPEPKRAITRTIASTRFISAKPKMVSNRRPRFQG